MKHNTILNIGTGILLLCMAIACKPEMNKLSDSAIDANEIELAQTFVHDYFDTVANEAQYQIPDYMSAKMQENITPETMQKYHNEIIEDFGTFQSMEFVEAWEISNAPGLKIMRFKGTFTKTPEDVELRVTLDENGQLSGFEVKKWKDEPV